MRLPCRSSNPDRTNVRRDPCSIHRRERRLVPIPDNTNLNHSARLALLAVVCSGSLLPLRAQNDPATRVRNALEGGRRDDLTAAPEAEKEAMRIELRKYVGEQNTFNRSAIRELIKLNEVLTIDEHVALFHTLPAGVKHGRVAKMLTVATDPGVIARIAEHVYVDESVEGWFAPCVFVLPKSVLATRLIIEIGSNASELPLQVRQSLASLQQLRPEARRDVVRQWWSKNRSAFASRTYDAITPARQ